uniref:Uncharacterized protein n=1 Tax=Oryza nivara TaxID=4536 RepID=A0A0E0I8M2_ORYNI
MWAWEGKISILPFHSLFSLDSLLLPQVATTQGLPAAGHRPALGLVVIVVILVIGALFLILGLTGSSSFAMPRIRWSSTNPSTLRWRLYLSHRRRCKLAKEDSGLPLTTSAFALTARLSCSTSRRCRASPRGSTLDPSPSAARTPSFLMVYRKKPLTVEPELKLLPDPEFPRAWLWRCTPLWRGRRIRTPLSLAGAPNAVEGLSSSGAVG